MCIDIVEIWFGIAIGFVSLILTELSPHDTTMGVGGIIILGFFFSYLSQKMQLDISCELSLIIETNCM